MKRSRVKDYQRKKYRNPLFPKKNRLKLKLGPKIAVPTVLAVIIAGFIFFNSAPQFKITDLQITGNKLIATGDIMVVVNEQLAQDRYFIINQDSIIFLSKSALSKALTEKFPFENVRINKNIFHTLKIEITEKDFSLMLQTGGERYFIDQRGIVADKVENIEFTIQNVTADTQLIRPEVIADRMPIITDESNQPVSVGSQIFSAELVKFIINLNSQLKDVAGVSVVDYSIKDAAAPEIVANTREGWQGMFNVKTDPASQAKLLNMILIQKVADRGKLKYIDLRFEGKVFYQ